MPLSGKHEFLIHDSKDKIYNFYLNEKEEISCISSNHQRKWTDKENVFEKRCSSLDIEIDDKDQIHIVSYHYDGDLYYNYKAKEHWKNIQLTKLKRSEKIFYPKIKTIGKKIHIFYDLQQGNEKERCALFHYTFDEKEKTWISNNVCTMRFNKFVNPYKVMSYQNQIIILYTSIVNQKEELFIVHYDSANNQWGKPQQLTNSNDRKLYLDGFIDFNGYLHMVWCHYQEENGLTVKYLKSDFKNINFSEKDIVTLSTQLNCSFPHLVFINKKIYCMWVQFSHLAVVTSGDYGKNWSKPEVESNSKTKSFKRYRYSVNKPDFKNNLISDFLYGTEYPSIEFLGFGGDQYDEVPTNES
ncbi:hypothetical protein [Alkaliphilus transvaalensis]|uniref:hypothetical protein n=1 Tax=Alkaliphilus transvaalensis TaxID=114628 RepID=UPI00047AC7D6|nr:hypothetical protein [Alkaliphilus transvaalensis]